MPGILRRINLAALLERLNFHLPVGRRQWIEFTELWMHVLFLTCSHAPLITVANIFNRVPPYLKHALQTTFDELWTRRIFLLQERSPAETIYHILKALLPDHIGREDTDWAVVDFGSGTGGPLPQIESLVNSNYSPSPSPMEFLMTDTVPNLDAWMKWSSRSPHLSFIPQPVDAANPPFSVISVTTPGDKEAARLQGYESNGRKAFRLYCSTFHRFSEETAIKVMKSTTQTCDAFATVEMHERTILSLLLIMLERFWLYLITFFCFPLGEGYLMFTYMIPILPAMRFWDSLVSCLRTRKLAEIAQLAEKASGETTVPHYSCGGVTVGEWELEQHRVLHTWPVGYVTVISGNIKKSEEEESHEEVWRLRSRSRSAVRTVGIAKRT